MATEPFENSFTMMYELLSKSKLVAKGKTLSEAGINYSWVMLYAKTAERADRYLRHGLTRYFCEPNGSVNSFLGSLFNHKE